jgi:hypothetical protein
MGRVILAGDAAHVFPPCKYIVIYYYALFMHSDAPKLAAKELPRDFETHPV